MKSGCEQTVFKPGFRFSLFDGAILILGLLAAMAGSAIARDIPVIIGCSLLHFFLFCNVFRISRMFELLWAALFIILSAATILTGIPGWTATVLISVLASVIVIFLEMRKPYYHGLDGSV